MRGFCYFCECQQDYKVRTFSTLVDTKIHGYSVHSTVDPAWPRVRILHKHTIYALLKINSWYRLIKIRQIFAAAVVVDDVVVAVFVLLLLLLLQLPKSREPTKRQKENGINSADNWFGPYLPTYVRTYVCGYSQFSPYLSPSIYLISLCFGLTNNLNLIHPSY